MEHQRPRELDMANGMESGGQADLSTDPNTDLGFDPNNPLLPQGMQLPPGMILPMQDPYDPLTYAARRNALAPDGLRGGLPPTVRYNSGAVPFNPLRVGAGGITNLPQHPFPTDADMARVGDTLGGQVYWPGDTLPPVAQVKP